MIILGKWKALNPATLMLFGAKDESEFISLKPWDVAPDFHPDGSSSTEKAQKMLEATILEGSQFFELELYS
ncbi:MAG: hypothetical protein CVU90_07140 [Firmicutes bacterium HGW-Firmicutes-15]|nr:MAG: hypothetical protein CVU90_07140 [Firmicutes bacterium HGW-Firmicutes-15]